MKQILLKANNHSSFHEHVEMSSPLYCLKYHRGLLVLCRPGICWLSAASPNANSLSRSPANSCTSKPQSQFSQGLCLLLILQALTVLSLSRKAQEKLPAARACSNTRLWCFVFHLLQREQQHHPAARAYRFFTVSLTSQCVSSNWSRRNETCTFSGRLPMYTKLRLLSP